MQETRGSISISYTALSSVLKPERQCFTILTYSQRNLLLEKRVTGVNSEVSTAVKIKILTIWLYGSLQGGYLHVQSRT
jgi:hypothetical protein